MARHGCKSLAIGTSGFGSSATRVSSTSNGARAISRRGRCRRRAEFFDRASVPGGKRGCGVLSIDCLSARPEPFVDCGPYGPDQRPTEVLRRLPDREISTNLAHRERDITEIRQPENQASDLQNPFWGKRGRSAIWTFTIRPEHHVVLSLSQRLRSFCVVIASRSVVSANAGDSCENAARTKTAAMADLVAFAFIISFFYSTLIRFTRRCHGSESRSLLAISSQPLAPSIIRSETSCQGRRQPRFSVVLAGPLFA